MSHKKTRIRTKIRINFVRGIKYHSLITSASRKKSDIKKLDQFQKSITFTPSLTGNDHISLHWIVSIASLF